MRSLAGKGGSMRTHVLQLGTELCDAVMFDGKNFEIRKNELGYQKGDLIKFQAVCRSVMVDHSINERLYEITYVLSGRGIKNGFVVFGIREVIPDVSHNSCAS